MKRRRGRQPRQSLVTPMLLVAVNRLTSQLGAPIFLEEEGFRDISGWLKHIRSSHLRDSWLSFCEAYVDESAVFQEDNHDKLKEDLIQEIMKLVITRHPKESTKVVLTNARRQSKPSSSGQTVRNVFETYLADCKEMKHATSESKRREAGSSQSHARLSRKSNTSGRSSSSSHSTGIDILSLLTNDKPPSRRHGMSSESSKLPSMTQFDEEIRSRSAKDRRKH